MAGGRPERRIPGRVRARQVGPVALGGKHEAEEEGQGLSCPRWQRLLGELKAQATIVNPEDEVLEEEAASLVQGKEPLLQVRS
ncbi:unnamed protein product [Caretta caretta]